AACRTAESSAVAESGLARNAHLWATCRRAASVIQNDSGLPPRTGLSRRARLRVTPGCTGWGEPMPAMRRRHLITLLGGALDLAAGWVQSASSLLNGLDRLKNFNFQTVRESDRWFIEQKERWVAHEGAAPRALACRGKGEIAMTTRRHGPH